MKNILKSCFALFFLGFFANFSLAQTGTIKGKLMDETSGEPMMFATVFIPQTSDGTTTDFDGYYEVEVPVGTYTLEISSVGYANITITDVIVKEGEVTVIDYVVQSKAETIDIDVTVTAKSINRSEVALLTLRQKSLGIENSLSAQGMAKYAASNAADAVKRTTGTSIVGGKYVYVRGLGDRYSNARLNGMPLPSTDPYRNSTQLDLIPSNLLENIILSKTFLPDQPGDFAGGSVNINTKTYPEDFTFNVTTSFNYNTQSSFNNSFLTHEGGNTDWLGYDDGSRALDDYLLSENYFTEVTTSAYTRARRDNPEFDELRTIIDRSAKAFNSQGQATQTESFMDHGIAASVGNSYKLFGNDLGFGLGVSYKRNYDHYGNAEQNYFEIQGPTLEPFYDLADTRSTENAVVSGLFTLGYKIGKSSDIQFNALYNHDGWKSSRYLEGVDAEVEGTFTSRALEFRERTLEGYQMNFQHTFTTNKEGEAPKTIAKLEAGGQIVNMIQDEPDIRFVADQRVYNEDEDIFVYRFNQAQFDLPVHIWRNLEDEQKSARLDLTFPDIIDKKTDSTSLNFMVKVGGAYSKKNRVFTENSYILNNPNVAKGREYEGDPNDFFARDNMGLIGFDETQSNPHLIGLYWRYERPTSLGNSYTGENEVTAAYGMGVLEYNKFKAIFGARMEQTNIFAASQDTTNQSIPTDTTSILPSLNLVYAVNESMNIRGSYTKTLARPNMREVAPFAAADYNGGFILSGNSGLKLTDITNYDLRWEWFPGEKSKGELVSVSAFYKKFENPIVTSFVIIAANPELRYENVNDASLYGLEFELRKNLGFISPKLEDLTFLTNIALMKSSSDIPADEVAVIEQFNPEKGSTRPFYGQSPYIVNAALNYQGENNLDVMLSLNVFGERIVQLAEGANPDVYEQPRAGLDLTVSKKLTKNFSFRFAAKNMLNAVNRQTVTFGGEELDVVRFRRGVDFSLGITYQL